MPEILKKADINPLLKWAKGDTKKFVSAGFKGNINELGKILSTYSFFATLDSSMASMIIAFIVCCIKSKDPNLKKFGLSVLRNGSSLNKLFEYLKEGDGKKVKYYMGSYFQAALGTVLQTALPDDKDNGIDNKDKRAKIIKSFINRAGKITPWKINGQEISDVIDRLIGSAAKETNKSMMQKEAEDKSKDAHHEMMYREFLATSLGVDDNGNWKDRVKVFPKGKPLPSEVRQTHNNDCVLMSVLISLAKTNPKAIKDCFVQGLDKIEKEDKIDIRFFRYDIGRFDDESLLLMVNHIKPVTVIITIKKEQIMDLYRIKDGALWPLLIEEAYAEYVKRGYADFDGNPMRIDDGESGEFALFAITGKIAKKMHSSQYPRQKASESVSVIDTIKRKLETSKSLWCGFKKDFQIKDAKSNETIKIFDEHAYAIVGINEDKKYIRLIEPYRSGGRQKTKFLKNREGGHIAMSFDDFENNFMAFQYLTNKTLPDLLKKRH